MSKSQCTFCKKTKQKIRGEKIKSGKRFRYKYYDENHLTWAGNTCRECHRGQVKQCHYKAGRHKPIDNVKNHAQVVGRKSECTAKKYFEKLGYVVEHTTYLGPDLTIKKGNKKFTVEVKTACKTKQGHWMIGRVLATRNKDDLIAIVYKDLVIVEPMKFHLSKEPPKGPRSISSLMKGLIK